MLCEKQGLSPSDLSYIAVGIGPGSYTGIRVAVAFAKALSFALSIPLVGVSSLQLFCPLNDHEGPFFSVVDARIGGVYLAKGSVGAGKVVFKGEDVLVAFDEFTSMLHDDMMLVTPNYAPIQKRLEAREVKKQICVLEQYPNVHFFAKEAYKKYIKKAYTLDGTLPLVYLRKATY